MTVVNYLFGFHGRINRAKWWLFLILFAVYVVIIQYLVIPLRINFAVWLILMAPVWYAALAVSTKRLQDRNKPMAWTVLLVAVPILIWLYKAYATWAATQADLAMDQARTPEEMQAAAQALQIAHQGTASYLGSLGWVLLAAQIVLVAWAIIELGLLKGTTGNNPYGVDPLANIQH